jgi:hypothetical protein
VPSRSKKIVSMGSGLERCGMTCLRIVIPLYFFG